MSVQAITTMYDGIEYRSRLEARWAAFFHRLKWQFTYEPFDGNGYIPDFLIHGDFPMLIEVKPAVTPDDFTAPIEKIDRGLKDVWDGRILIVGLDPLPYLTSDYDRSPVAGFLRESINPYEPDDLCWNHGLWHPSSTPLSVCHEYMSYACSPSGYYDGNNGDWRGVPGTLQYIRDMWAAACNDSKWRG